MSTYDRIYREKRNKIFKIIVPLFLTVCSGYFLNVLIIKEFFVGWEKYFAFACLISILLSLIIIDAGIVGWMIYDIYILDGKLKINEGLFTRVISIPLDRIYYVSTVFNKSNRLYDTILIIDKKITHKNIKILEQEEFKDIDEHYESIMRLKNIYKGKTFYYYRINHKSYKFLHYLYLLYKNCEKCKFSDTSMELVKKFVNQK